VSKKKKKKKGKNKKKKKKIKTPKPPPIKHLSRWKPLGLSQEVKNMTWVFRGFLRDLPGFKKLPLLYQR
jgi:hypothetical protein